MKSPFIRHRYLLRVFSWLVAGGGKLGLLLSFLGRWPALVLSIPSIYLLSFYPPLWKDVDALSQLVLPAGAANILHFPPVYCFLGRIPFSIASWVAGAGGGPSHPEVLSLFDQQRPPLAGIYLLVVCQHLALIGALTYTVMSLAQERVLRGVFALALASCSSFYTHAQCCGSEALSISATFSLFAAGVSMIRRSGAAHWYAYAAALFLAIGSRHINVLFSAWLPFTLAILTVGKKFGCHWSEAGYSDWKATGVTALIGVLAIGSNICLARLMINAVHDEYRSTLGRTLSDGIARFLNELPEGAKLQLAEDLAAKTPDPLVRAAVRSQAITGSFYNGTQQQIENELIRSGVSSNKVGAETDRIILSATMRYLLTFHPVLIRVVAQDIRTGLIRVTNPNIAISPFEANESAAKDKEKRSGGWQSLNELQSLNFEKAAVLLNAARHDPYIHFWGKARMTALIFLALSFGVAACLFAGRLIEMVLIGWCVLLSGVTVYAANAVCVYYMDRYTLPLFITVMVAFLACLGAFCRQAAPGRLAG